MCRRDFCTRIPRVLGVIVEPFYDDALLKSPAID